jgi:hypothetical protein
LPATNSKFQQAGCGEPGLRREYKRFSRVDSIALLNCSVAGPLTLGIDSDGSKGKPSSVGVIVMIAQNTRKILSVVLSLMLTTASSPLLYGSQNQSPENDSGNPTDTIPQSAAELQALVTPIALYPDSLVAQILSASTFPDQVAIADYWLQQNSSL